MDAVSGNRFLWFLGDRGMVFTFTPVPATIRVRRCQDWFSFYEKTAFNARFAICGEDFLAFLCYVGGTKTNGRYL